MLITFTRQRNLRAFRRRLGLKYRARADETRAVYRAYGLGRGCWWRIWSWRTLRTYGRLLRAGHRLRRPTEDTRQLGGDTSSSMPAVGLPACIGHARLTTGPPSTS